MTKAPCHLVDDEIGWLSDWTPRPVAQQQEMAFALAAADAWILDSAYAQWREAVMPRAQLIVGLDYPRWLSLARLVRRSIRRLRRRELVCNGNQESLRKLLSADSIVLWHFKSFARKRRNMRALPADPGNAQVVILPHPREARRWLDQRAAASPAQ